MNYNLIIDIGTSNTVIYKAGMGIVLKEPSLIAIENVGKKKRVNSVGIAAKNLIGRGDKDIEVFEPVVAGDVTNFAYTRLMLKEFLKKISNGKSSFNYRSKVVFLTDCGTSPETKNFIKDVGYGIGFVSCATLPAVVAALVGMDIEPTDTQSHLVIEIGGGTTNIAVINGTTILRGCTICMGGANLDHAIVQCVKEKFGITITTPVGKSIKHDIMSLFDNDRRRIRIYGMDEDGKKKEAVIATNDILPIAVNFYSKVAIAIESIINMCSPEVVADITKTGCYMCGGDTLVDGLDKYFREKLGLSVYIALDPDNVVIKGAGRLLSSPKLLNSIVSK